MKGATLIKGGLKWALRNWIAYTVVVAYRRASLLTMVALLYLHFDGNVVQKQLEALHEGMYGILYGMSKQKDFFTMVALSYLHFDGNVVQKQLEALQEGMYGILYGMSKQKD